MLSLTTFKDAGKLALTTTAKKNAYPGSALDHVRLQLVTDDKPRLVFTSTDRVIMTRINMPIDDEILAALRAEEVFGDDNSEARYFNKATFEGIIGVHASLDLSAEILNMHLSPEAMFDWSYPNVDKILTNINSRGNADLSDPAQISAVNPKLLGNCLKAIGMTKEYKDKPAKMRVLFGRSDKTEARSSKMFVIESPEITKTSTELPALKWSYIVAIMGLTLMPEMS